MKNVPKQIREMLKHIFHPLQMGEGYAFLLYRLFKFDEV